MSSRRAASASAADLDAWRSEVGGFRAANPRRLFPMVVHVGLPGASRVEAPVDWPVPPEYDAGLRFDVVAALLDRWRSDGHPGYAFAWLTRPGPTEIHDVDLAWHSAARHAFEAAQVGMVGFRVVTKGGWLDVVTGERRLWKRLRLDRGPAHPSRR